MKVPSEINMGTKNFVQVFTKFCLYLSQFGPKAMEDYLDNLPLKMCETEGKHVRAYIANKVCQEYQESGQLISKYDLFNSTERRQDIAEARMLYCVLEHKYLQLSNVQIAREFNKSRHFTKRALIDFRELDESIPTHRKAIAKFKKLDALVHAYCNFKPKS